MATKKKETAAQEELKEFQSELGGVLKQARESQKLSIKDVCTRLHFNESQINGMETDDFSIFNDPSHARAFIRSYARLLGLNEEVLLNKHRELFPSQVFNPIDVKTETMALSSKKSFEFPKYGLVIGLLVILGIAAWFFAAAHFGGSSEEKAAEVASTVEALPEVALPAAERSQEDAGKQLVTEIQLPQSQSNQDQSKQVQSNQGQSNQTPAVAANNESLKSDANKPSTANKSVDTKAKAGDVSVKLVFSEASWVSVKDSNGKTLCSKVAKAGSEETVQGVPPLNLHVGNAKGTQIFLNGQAVDLSSSTYNNMARLVLGAE
jgi:cytoskeleton protein RodZ